MRQQVPQSARTALAHLADLMRRGFTGRIELDCNEGGIVSITTSERLRVDRLPREREG